MHMKVLQSRVRVYLPFFEPGLLCLALTNGSSCGCAVLTVGLKRPGGLGSPSCDISATV